MIVHPHFLDHWKVRALSEKLGDRLSAIQAMLRVWGHCQEMKEWVFKLDAWRLASICRDWQGPAEVLWNAMTDAEIRVLEDAGDGNWEVHEWAVENASLTSAWSKGRKGGRKSAELGRKRQAGVVAGLQPIGLDRIGQDGSIGSHSPASSSAPGWSAEEWANRIHPMFSGRRDGEMECKGAIAADIAGGQDPEELVRNVRLIVGYIEGRAPGGWANVFIPRGVKFWMERQWRNPEAFAQRWDEVKKNKRGAPNQTPAVALRYTTHRDLPEPPCQWRRLMEEVFPQEEYPAADYTLSWGLYEPDIRAAVLKYAVEKGFLEAGWKQPGPPPGE